jgi:hypothetical protein
VLADRSLAQVQDVGGTLETPGIGDSDEAAQRGNVQRAVHALTILYFLYRERRDYPHAKPQ